jgi:SAM-dependent methyltransferase
VTGIDLPRPDRAHFPSSVRLVEVDLDAGLPSLGEKFDFIVCADVLEHLLRPARSLVELRGMLADAGTLVASLPNSGHAYFRWNVLLGRFPQDRRGLFDRTHLHFFPWQGWVDLFASAGFRLDAVHCSGVPVSLALPRWAHSRPVRALEWLSYETARCWKTMFAYQFVVTAKPEAVR